MMPIKDESGNAVGYNVSDKALRNKPQGIETRKPIIALGISDLMQRRVAESLFALFRGKSMPSR
jgi:hypothetical protein